MSGDPKRPLLGPGDTAHTALRRHVVRILAERPELLELAIRSRAERDRRISARLDSGEIRRPVIYPACVLFMAGILWAGRGWLLW